MGHCSTNQVKQAVILSGGLGTRLGKATSNLPKPLMPIGGKPFLSYLLQHLHRQGIERFILTASFKSEIMHCYSDMENELGLNIVVVEEKEPLGTGGALRNCLDLLDDVFLVCNGDTLLDFNVAQLQHSAGENCAITVRAVDDVSRFGSVDVSDGQIVAFDEKGRTGKGLISGGNYLLRRNIVENMQPGKSSIEKHCLPKLVRERRIHAVKVDGYFIDIGTPSTLEEARTSLIKWHNKPIAFLDRDGVLNIDHGYVHKKENFDWTEDSKKAVRYLNTNGYHVVLVTNQAGIARGYYREEDFRSLTTWMRAQLWEHGAHLDKVYYCPYHVDGMIDKYKKPSYDRKPNPGMLFRAFRELPSVVNGSFFVGDRDTDKLAAEAAGVPFCEYKNSSLYDTITNFLKKIE